MVRNGGKGLVEKAKKIYQDIPIDPSSLDVCVRLMELQEELKQGPAGKYASVDVDSVNSSLR